VAPVRRELGVTTIMNLLGPLANPARVRRQVVGVAHAELLRLVAESLLELGHERALVVHGEPGLDELSPLGPTRAFYLSNGEIRELLIHPSDFGWPEMAMTDLAGGEPEANAAKVERVIRGEEGGGGRAAVVLNAGAALWVAGVATDLADGVRRAQESIDEGRAGAKLDRLAGG
jgi:anthranilate phosphoribosyltransferase